jgi:type IV secretory pathway VirB2 component (pilin)
MRKLIILIILLAILVPVSVTHAQANPCVTSYDSLGNRLPGNLGRCINQIYLWALAVAAILAVLGVIAGGYQLMTASGNAQQASEGKERFLAAAIGLGILFTAYIVLNTINPDLVDFRDLTPGNFPPAPASTVPPPPPPPGPQSP